MKRPKILLLMHYMELGGAESAFLGLLQAVDPARADVDVFIYDHRGELMTYLDSEESGRVPRFHLLPEVAPYNLLERPLKEVVQKGDYRLAWARIKGILETRRFAKKNVEGLDNASAMTYQGRQTAKVLPKINTEVEYDLAVSFMTPHYIVLDKVRAKRKVGWIHTDYTKIFIDREMELEMWSRLDWIGSISQEASKAFLQVFPSLKKKIVEIENILSSDFIRRRAEEPLPVKNYPDRDKITLLSIGRYCNPKRFDEVGTICRIVREAGVDIHWFIIGYGDDAPIRQNFQAEGMEEYVTILGKQTNPYPFINQCDVYVQPSRYEGKSITVREAQILCKPVVITNYTTAASQVQPGRDGEIVPMPTAECAEGIAAFVKDTMKQKEIMAYLASHDYGNEGEIEKIYQLINS